jgi:WD40 repeat protein
MTPKVTSKLELHGAAATSSQHSLLYLKDDGGAVVYPSNCIINIAKPILQNNSNLEKEDNNNDKLYNVETTLRTCTVPRQKDCMGRSITSMELLQPTNSSIQNDVVNHVVKNMILSAFSDGSLTLWRQCKDNTWQETVIIGKTNSDGDNGNGSQAECNQDDCHDSITDVDGVYSIMQNPLSSSMKIQTMLLTSSSTGVKCYHYTIALSNSPDGDSIIGTEIQSSTKIASYPTSTIQVTMEMTQDASLLVLAVGTALPRHNRIHFYSLPMATTSTTTSINDCQQWKHQGSLLGHLGWISCLDWIKVDDYILLASGSHDSRIRLWKFHASVLCDENDVTIATDDNIDIEIDINDEMEDGHDDDLVEEGEARMYLRFSNMNEQDDTMVQVAVTLEALLIGHEEQVTAVSWRPNSATPCLISSSMDRSVLIWMEENDYTATGEMTTIEGVGNVWAPVTRVGTAGGILGGSVGSSLLGFINVTFNTTGDEIIGHGYGGSIYFWSCHRHHRGDGGDDIDSVEMERWRAKPCITGHFRGCSDISWEASKGLYLLSAGLDQTCRLWSYLPSVSTQEKKIWREIGRPQVHGYDLNAIACIGNGNDGNGELIHRFVSGADEKEARVFDAPVSTLKLLSMFHGEEVQDDESANRVERAFIPSLGLSNRATADDAMEEDSFANSGKEGMVLDGKNIQSNNRVLKSLKETIDILPHERDLGVISLWPEVRKLYGHQTELICLKSNAEHCKRYGGKVLLASSCKARDAENAVIRIWDVEKNMCLDILKDGHKSTVTSLAFCSDGKFLASSGKDRRLCIWRKNDMSNETKYDLALQVESSHKRIVWDIDFCPFDPSLLCTGSRDGSIKLWRLSDSCEADDDSTPMIKELHRWEPFNKTSKNVEPITAIAFAPKPLGKSAVIAMGLECGLIEIWSIPLDEELGKQHSTLLHSIPPTNCYIGAVKKMAWQPITIDNDNQGKQWECTLASCSLDHGVRIHRICEE